ncbi:MAG TPA: hypothetical protein VE978_04760 [Chitinophagales bacterium]|nr:hypothetical protein [Chitinophagales bacterium]
MKHSLLTFPTIIAFAVAGFFNKANAQASTFLKTYNNGDMGYAVREVNGNTYAVCGGTDYYYNWHWLSMTPIATTNIHFFKTDDKGNLVWEKIFSHLNSRTIATWFEHTADGGYIITGRDNKDVTWPPDSNNVVLIKTDATGTIVWSKLYDSGKDELGSCVQQTFDGGYIVSGFHDAVPVSIVGNTYVLLIKTDASGNIEWGKRYQGAVRDLATSEPMTYVIRQTADSGYVVVGTTAGSHAADVYVIRTDVDGDVAWAKSYEHDNSMNRFSVGLDIMESDSGDFIIGGSMDKDRLLNQFNYPYILKISSAGAIIDARFYESVPFEMFQTGFSSVVQTTDEGFFFTGMGGYSGIGTLAQLLKTDNDFTLRWSHTYTWDGNVTMGSRCGLQTSDDAYIFTGKRQFAGTLLMKTDSVGIIPCKTPGDLVEYLPGLITQTWNPAVSAVMNASDLALTTQSPSLDTSILCEVEFLPIELSDFSATAIKNKKVQVKWITSSEMNSDYFVVEKSEDGNYFKQAGIIKGAGNSISVLNYSFIDEHPFDVSTSYYRLRQVDNDGAADFSRVVPVSFEGKDFELLNTFGDYENQTIKIYLKDNSSENIEYTLIDMLDKTISHGLQTSVDGVSLITINATHLPRGIYYIRLSNGNKVLSGGVFY